MTRVTEAARRLARAEDGAVTALVALSLVGLVGVGVLAFDYSRLVALDTELQNAADHAALAAATQLEDETCAAPEEAARRLVANETRFATDDDTPIISIEEVVCNNGQVTVTVEARTVDYALTPIHMMTVDERRGTTRARATAVLRSAICKVPPLMICNPTPGEGAFDVAQHIGKGLELVGGGGAAWAPGNFGFLDVGADNVGMPDLMDAIGKVSTSLTCVSADEDTGVDMDPGLGAAFVGAFNTRFDIYDNGWARNNCGINSAGSGMSYCPPALNVTKDVIRPATGGTANSCTLGPAAWRLPNNQYLPQQGAGYTTPAQPLRKDPDGADAMGHPRDICHAVTADGDCPDGPIGDSNWDREQYFLVNHPGNTTWQTQLGATPTRYQVYRWEIQNAASGTLAPHDVSPRRSYQAPICAAGLGAGPSTADRRLASVAVINCNENDVNGAAVGVPVEQWIDVFLVEPAINRPRTQAAEIYVEIVGETIMAGNGNQPQLIRRDVPVLVR